MARDTQRIELRAEHNRSLR